MHSKKISTLKIYFFQNVLDSETFVNFQNMLMPKSNSIFKMEAIQSVPMKMFRQMQQILAFFKDKEEYVLNRREKL